MSAYFDEFTEQELQHYQEVFGDNYEYDEYEQSVTLDQPNADFNVTIKFFKKDDSVYVLSEEDEGMYEQRDGAIYYLEPNWWYKVDMEAILKDYAEGTEIDPNEYRVWE